MVYNFKLAMRAVCRQIIVSLSITSSKVSTLLSQKMLKNVWNCYGFIISEFHCWWTTSIFVLLQFYVWFNISIMHFSRLQYFPHCYIFLSWFGWNMSFLIIGQKLSCWYHFDFVYVINLFQHIFISRKIQN